MWTQRMTLLTVLAVAAGGSCVATNASDPTVVDLPASQLSIQPTIIDDDPAPGDGMLPIVVQFYRGNEFVKLAGTAAVTCNGMPLLWTGLGYGARVPLPAAGSTLVFGHLRAGTMAQLTIKVPPRLVMVSPVAGAMLTRSANLAIGYTASNSAGVRPSAADSRLGVAGSEQEDSGTAYLDVTALRAGAGTIAVSRRFLSVPASTGFQSVIANYTITSASTQVSWQ
jgi:hypothetical protein